MEKIINLKVIIPDTMNLFFASQSRSQCSIRLNKMFHVAPLVEESCAASTRRKFGFSQNILFKLSLCFNRTNTFHILPPSLMQENVQLDGTTTGQFAKTRHGPLSKPSINGYFSSCSGVL